MNQPLVEVVTGGFAFRIAVCAAEAPVSSAYFLRDVDAGVLEGSTVFRIVNLHSQLATVAAKIAVLQMGLREANTAIAPSIKHESTGATGLRHRRGTVSLARFAPGAVYHSIFVCMRDEPALDEGGARHPDGLGFAAFGTVVQGFECLQRLFDAHSRSPEYPESPVRLLTVRRIIASS